LLNTDGSDMTVEEWNTNYIRCMGMLLNGQIMNGMDLNGNYITDDVLLILVNAYWENITFTLPNDELGKYWEIMVDTSLDKIPDIPLTISERFEIPGRSLILLKNIRKKNL
jgi:isoamylase